MINLKELEKRGFKVKVRRKRTIDTNLKIVEITALFEGNGGYTKTFAYDGEKLYEVASVTEKIPSKWGVKIKLDYITKDKIIDNFNDLCKDYIESYNIVPYQFQKGA